MSHSFQYFDTHCHLAHLSPNDPNWKLFPSYPLLSVSTTLQDALLTLQYASSYDNILPAVGLHPWFLSDNISDDLSTLEQLLHTHTIFAIGEIGLDYHPHVKTDHNLQWILFTKQLELAQKYQLPVSIHMVKAVEPVLKALDLYPDIHGVIHGFYGSSEVARRFIQRGFKIGVGPLLLRTAPNKLYRVLLDQPLETFVLETDFPYGVKYGVHQLTGLSLIAQKMSEVTGVPLPQILNVTTQTAKEIFYERTSC